MPEAIGIADFDSIKVDHARCYIGNLLHFILDHNRWVDHDVRSFDL